MSLTCPDLYRLIFHTFYHFLAKREINETVNFRKFRKSFTNKFPRFYGILASHFQTAKTKEVNDKAHEEACCNEVNVSASHKNEEDSDNQNE